VPTFLSCKTSYNRSYEIQDIIFNKRLKLVQNKGAKVLLHNTFCLVAAAVLLVSLFHQNSSGNSLTIPMWDTRFSWQWRFKLRSGMYVCSVAVGHQCFRSCCLHLQGKVTWTPSQCLTIYQIPHITWNTDTNYSLISISICIFYFHHEQSSLSHVTGSAISKQLLHQQHYKVYQYLDS